MEGNKDDALKCLKIGKDALESGDLIRARKFITKAQRLDPSLDVDGLLSSLENDKETPSSSPSTPAEEFPTAAGLPNLRNRSKQAPSSSSASSASYTEEQITIVRQINKKKDYYDILGLQKDCSVEDVRKSYRKLSLKVHPDKNQAPGAEDAFKSVSKAFQCLSNEESRKKYDLTGSDEIVYERRTTSRRYQGGFNGYYDEFDPDEIFRQFFFGGMQPGNPAQFRTFNFGGATRGGGNVHAEGSGMNFRALIQLLPVLLIVLFQFLPSSEPVYSLSRVYPYEYKFTTQRGVNYFVKSSSRHNEDYPLNSNERMMMEDRVEREYKQVLLHNCRQEYQRQQWGFSRDAPHCDMLEKFQSPSQYSSEASAAA